MRDVATRFLSAIARLRMERLDVGRALKPLSTLQPVARYPTSALRAKVSDSNLDELSRLVH